MFSWMSVYHSVQRVPCNHYPWCIKPHSTAPPPPRTGPCPLPTVQNSRTPSVQGPSPASDIWRPRLETHLNMFTWGPPQLVLTSDGYCSSYSGRAGHIHSTGMLSSLCSWSQEIFAYFLRKLREEIEISTSSCITKLQTSLPVTRKKIIWLRLLTFWPINPVPAATSRILLSLLTRTKSSNSSRCLSSWYPQVSISLKEWNMNQMYRRCNYSHNPESFVIWNCNSRMCWNCVCSYLFIAFGPQIIPLGQLLGWSLRIPNYSISLFLSFGDILL